MADSGLTNGAKADESQLLDTRPKVEETIVNPVRVYLTAAELAFGSNVDYAMLVKIYGSDPREDQTRYSAAQCTGIQMAVATRRPDPKHIITSYVERQNWSVRTAMRRYTRLSKGFSRKIENHVAGWMLAFLVVVWPRIPRPNNDICLSICSSLRTGGEKVLRFHSSGQLCGNEA